ncbi:MAG: ribonuclease HI [Desulfonatronovibrio sp.]
MSNSSMPDVVVYTDGACLKNPGPGGYGAVLLYKDRKKEIAKGYPETTNNRMELLGVISALKELKYPCRIKVYTDSQYIAKAVNQKWLDKWKRNGWKTSGRNDVKNKDLWQELISLLDKHSVEFSWVKAHNGDHYNERCDQLAKKAAKEAAVLA